MQARKLTNRVLVIASLVVTFLFLAFSVVVDFHQRTLVRADIEEALTTQGHLSGEAITNWLTGRVLLTEQVAGAVGHDPSAPLAALQTDTLKREFLFTYFGDTSGAFTIWPASDMPAGYDPRERPWYKDAVAAKGPVLTEPYIDAASGQMIISAAVPVMQNGQLAGVIASDFSIESLGTLIKTIDFGGAGFAFLVDDKGTILVHPDVKLVTKSFSETYGSQLPTQTDKVEEMTLGGEQTLVGLVSLTGLPSVKWRLGMSVSRDAAFASMTDFRLTALTATVVAALVMIFVLLLLLRNGVARPLVGMTQAMQTLAAGNLDTEVPALSRRDEIGAMATAVEVFKQHALARTRLEREQAESAAARQRRTVALDGLIGDFDTELSGLIGLVSQSADTLQVTASALATTADTSAIEATSAASASEQASNNVRSVAAASEELSASIGEIARRVATSREIASRASQSAQTADQTVASLAATTQKIGQIVSLISDIASQTNLLALNATIEAARAGEAGRGFAVVATEVKALASQTARSTEEIAVQIAAMQGVSDEAVKAIGAIVNVIEEINHVSADISDSVEQQGGATQEIARNVQEAAKGTLDVAASMTTVTRQAALTGNSANEVLTASRELTREADTLRAKVAGFFGAIRAA